ncbi:MAG TPA: Rne/Rng family ribonuclease, partial [Thermoanaerobaculia bacterium]|nr:Rne/Rng family ribonuclease [Thermoanaerobaculia bacterium]
MTRRMLINAQKPEELRIATIDGSTLEGYQLEVGDRHLTRGNIYRGVIASIQPSLNAAFIDYGAERHGFLAIQDVVPEAYYRQPNGKERPRIDNVLDRGKPIVVQVTKEPEGQKGSALTTNLSLPGRYLVLMPFDGTTGVSRKVEGEELRKQLKESVGKLDVPTGCGVIVRTNAAGQSKTALNRDLSALLRVWKRVEGEARQGRGTKLLYSDQDLIVRALRDYLDSSIEEILVDDDAAYAKAEEYLKTFLPRTKIRLERYRDRAPLFARYDLEPQIERIYDRRVDLPSGGSIVIDRTEALTAIDVNSGRSTRAATQEETAAQTNVEAAREVARQLRLRDIGGLVVVDFIDMRSNKNQRKVEKELKEAMKPDKARSTVGRISANGLLEVNRQRIQQALLLRTHRACPTCGGAGRVASPEMVGLNLIRRIEGRAAGGALKSVRFGLHPELAEAVQNGRRQQLADLEREFDIRIEVVGVPRLNHAEQEVEWSDRDPAELQRRAAEAEAMAEPQPAAAAGEAAAEEPEEAGERARPRRRKRGGRRRGGRGKEAATETGERQTPPAASPAEGPAAVAADSP